MVKTVRWTVGQQADRQSPSSYAERLVGALMCAGFDICYSTESYFFEFKLFKVDI